MRIIRLLVALVLVGVGVATTQVVPGSGTRSGPANYEAVVNVAFPTTASGCGRASTTGDATTAIQCAIDYACTLTDLTAQGAHPEVFVPAGVYRITGISIGCSGLYLKGVAIAGGNPSNGSVLCSTSAAAGTMLTVGSAVTSVNNVKVEGILLSGFCGSFPQGIEVFCNRCMFEKMGISGYSTFGIRFLGKSSDGTGGFSTVQNSEIANGQANSFAFVIVTQGAGGGPDGQTFINNFVNTNNGWINDSTVAGAASLRSSQAFIGNKFNGVNAGAITAVTGQTDTDRFTANRFENTGTGSLTVLLNNTTTTNVAAIFVSNLWACGPLNCSWTDNSTTPAARFGEVMGPSNTGQSPGIVQADGTTTTSGAGSPVNLKIRQINAGTLSHAGDMLVYEAWGVAANNANAKTINVRSGAVNFVTLALTAGAASQWYCRAYIAWRQAGNNPQSVGGFCMQGAAVTMAIQNVSTVTMDFAANQNIAIQVAQVAAGDVVQNGAVTCVQSAGTANNGGAAAC